MGVEAIGRIGGILLVCLAMEPVGAAVIRVPGEYPKIRQALEASEPGDEIVVSPGRYAEVLTLPGWDVVLRSENPLDPKTVNSTVLDSAGLETVITFAGTESAACRVEGVTITGGNTWQLSSRPLAVEGNHCRATIRYCHIVENVRSGGFDGGTLARCDGRLEQNWFKDNDGGVLECDGEIVQNWFQSNTWAIRSSDAVIEGNLFQDNGKGGAIYDCTGRFINNTFRGNLTYNGGAAMSSCRGLIWGNVFLDNGSGSRGGAASNCSGTFLFNTFYRNKTWGYGGALYSCHGLIANCIFWQNEKVLSTGELDATAEALYLCDWPTSCCVQGLKVEGRGNFDVDPLFSDPVAGDVSLRPESPCIDAAGPVSMQFETDILGATRDHNVFEINLNGSDADMGALEYTGPPVHWDAPLPPVLLFPADGATTAPRQPVLRTSPFADAQPGSQFLASQWQLSGESGFASLLLDQRVTVGDKLHLFVSSQERKGVDTLYWRVRHENSGRAWSDWSEPADFTIRDQSIVYVPEDYPTVQEAIDRSESGGEIVVGPGTYKENLIIHGKDLFLHSRNPLDPVAVSSTILSGDWKDPVIRLDESVTSRTVISGFAITSGKAIYGPPNPQYGAGIACSGSCATIEYNQIVNNWLVSDFPIIAGASYVPMLTSPGFGGGIGQSRGVIRNNRIASNTCEGYGAGIYALDGVVENNTIVYNRSFSYRWYTVGGGIYTTGDTIIRNNILWENRGGWDGYTKTLDAQIIAPAYSYNCIQNWDGTSGGVGNIAEDPRLFDAFAPVIKLLPDSPCIDAGAALDPPYPDARGVARPVDGTAAPRGDGSDIDMGMIEYTPGDFYLGIVAHILGRAPVAGYPTDLNGDGQVDAADVTRSRATNSLSPAQSASSRSFSGGTF